MSRRQRLFADCLGFVVGLLVGAGLGTAFLLTVLRLADGVGQNPYLAVPAVIVTALIWIIGGWAVARCTGQMMREALGGAD